MPLVCYKQCGHHYETEQYAKHSRAVMLSTSRSHARLPKFSLSLRNHFIMASKMLKRPVQTFIVKLKLRMLEVYYFK